MNGGEERMEKKKEKRGDRSERRTTSTDVQKTETLKQYKRQGFLSQNWSHRQAEAAQTQFND